MIEVTGLSKRYGSTLAVDNLTFSVKPGVVTGFLGPNGAGKSTTLRMILGLDSPTSGQATINGRTYAELENPLRTVGSLLDAKAVHPKRSAANHLRWMAASNGIDTRRVDEVLGLVGLSDVAGRKAGGFSLGMAQRLGLAGALLGDPEYLLLDEPVNGLDPEGIRWVRTFLRSLAEEGRTILVSSHLLSEMSQTADHLLVIGRGRLVSDCPTEDFIRQSAQSTVLVRTDHPQELAAALQEENFHAERSHDPQGREILVVQGTTTDVVGGLAYSIGVAVHELTEQRGSLEDAFMRSTGDSVQYQSHTTTAAPQRPEGEI
ncbi:MULTISPECIES: ABC transporter ATP-binding protein [unclassified Corynebacterium]|uniref:ABC transporter ATP-binding protein n=1 Tax=unclassified Corynebacterium TaxID=2624378 RepID=UPI001C44623A|nr:MULTISPECIES: ABC transporter ATP-binding protein [unclassified Corynebacterium]MBV7282613.1 ABC transporter ATP-binding protein [Corynebacterium sp. TAE3-ERU30]MBV7302038.1 ABC transporter ATP-binding protein [Corynebacterium sp. TAE3-ERU2]